MYYIDSQRTLTRRDSSLIVPKKPLQLDEEGWSTVRGPSTCHLTSESVVSIAPRPKGSVRKEIITLLFESMLHNIVETWDVIVTSKADEISNIDVGKTPSELTVQKQKKKSTSAKPSKTSRRSRSRLELGETEIIQASPLSFWANPDERAIIHFRNGNMYEGSVSMKCMNGTGRFVWENGTIYMGQFKDNEICGTGIIQWKDDTWYDGHFSRNMRHGHGLYVNSRRQQSYAGDWHLGTKHGNGIINYTGISNSYNGEWEYNVRQGYGSREYSVTSGYKGDWDYYVREGNGVMIWPDHDFYTGQWKNGVMSGYGLYVWDIIFNNSMSLPSLKAYHGQWEKGLRNGYGMLNLGLGLGSHYKGEFKNNKKHGIGKLVSNNGLILQHKNLFVEDNLGTLLPDVSEEAIQKQIRTPEPFQFDICDSTVGLLYHIEQALNNLDKQQEIRTNLINEYIENNKVLDSDLCSIKKSDDEFSRNIEDVISFEEISLRKALRCYETELRNIYYMYATICNKGDIDFTPVMIRMYLWQLYYDCKVYEKGLNLVEIDDIYHANREWLSRSAHYPFEKIYFWQFIHSMINIASRLYAQRTLPGVRPETILASAFRKFMDTDVVPFVGRRDGKLVSEYGQFIPLKGLYKLYRSLGEPHTVRTFLCAIRHAPHLRDVTQPPLIDTPADDIVFGKNAFVFGDEMVYVADARGEIHDHETSANISDLKMFNFGNITSKAILKIFAAIFPQIYKDDKIMNLDIKMSFFEFFQAFVSCTEESIRVKDEETEWRKKLFEDMQIV